MLETPPDNDHIPKLLNSKLLIIVPGVRVFRSKTCFTLFYVSPQGLSRGSKEASRSRQNDPKRCPGGPPEAPGDPQRAPRSGQEHPRTAQKDTRRAPRAKNLPDVPQVVPRGPDVRLSSTKCTKATSNTWFRGFRASKTTVWLRFQCVKRSQTVVLEA